MTKKSRTIYNAGDWICNNNGDFIDKVKTVLSSEDLITEHGLRWRFNQIRHATSMEVFIKNNLED